MKIGDLVKWRTSEEERGLLLDTGIIVDGPRAVTLSYAAGAASYAVAWFDAKTTFWHNDFNLELLSENR